MTSARRVGCSVRKCLISNSVPGAIHKGQAWGWRQVATAIWGCLQKEKENSRPEVGGVTQRGWLQKLISEPTGLHGKAPGDAVGSDHLARGTNPVPSRGLSRDHAALGNLRHS